MSEVAFLDDTSLHAATGARPHERAHAWDSVSSTGPPCGQCALREGLVMLNTKEDPCTVEGADDGAGGFTIDVKW